MSVINPITFDKSVYSPGDVITATVSGNWEQVDTLTVKTPDGASGSGEFTIIQPLQPSDDGGRAWKVVSNTGTTGQLTASA